MEKPELVDPDEWEAFFASLLEKAATPPLTNADDIPGQSRTREQRACGAAVIELLKTKATKGEFVYGKTDGSATELLFSTQNILDHLIEHAQLKLKSKPHHHHQQHSVKYVMSGTDFKIVFSWLKSLVDAMQLNAHEFKLDSPGECEKIRLTRKPQRIHNQKSSRVQPSEGGQTGHQSERTSANTKAQASPAAPHLRVVESAEEGYGELIDYVRSEEFPSNTKATLLQLATIRPSQLIKELLKKGVDVLVYLPHVCVFEDDRSGAARASNHQLEVLPGCIDAIKHEIVRMGENSKAKPKGKLTIKYHRVPPSLLGVMIGTSRLLMGWFRYEPEGEVKSGQCTVFGHTERAILCVPGPGTDDFESLSAMFTAQARSYERASETVLEMDGCDEVYFKVGMPARLISDAFNMLARGDTGVSTALVYPEAEQAYSEMTTFVQDSKRKIKSAKLIQHSGKHSSSLVGALVKSNTPTTVYLQSKKTVKRILGESGVKHHYEAEAGNTRKHQQGKDLTRIFLEPVTSLSAVWIDYEDGDSFLFLSWYIYRTFVAYMQECKDNDMETLDFLDKDPREINKIWGHNQPGIIVFSNRGQDNGYQKLVKWFKDLLLHLDKRENTLNRSDEEVEKKAKNPDPS